jgi:hypothetical protein
VAIRPAETLLEPERASLLARGCGRWAAPVLGGLAPENPREAITVRGGVEGLGGGSMPLKGPLPLHLGDVVRLRKPHPCGEDRWEVLRVGADIRLRCLGCGRMIMIGRPDLERRVRAVLPAEPPPPGQS